MPLPLAAALAGGAALGAIGGALGKKSGGTQQIHLAAESELEKEAGRQSESGLKQLSGLVGAGAGEQDVMAGLQSQRSLAAMLGQFSQGGFMPTEQDWGTARQFASQQMQPQQAALSQLFEDEEQKRRRMAALRGRGAVDPVAMARMAQARAGQQLQLSAQEGAATSQFAQQLPGQRLGFAQQMAQVQGGLATQAMQNRQALLSAGQAIRGQEQQFRLGSATRTTSEKSGGGLGGALGGALAGMGSAGSLMSMFGGGRRDVPTK